MSVEVGDKAPDFTLPADGGGTVSLKALKGKPVVLYFYPKDDTSGCTAEACAFRDALPDFSKVKAEIVGISRDSVASHDKFKAKFELPFPLASDEDGKVCRGLRRVGREEHVWQEIYGHRAVDLPHRRQGRRPQAVAEGEGARPRRGRARGRGSAEIERRSGQDGAGAAKPKSAARPQRAASPDLAGARLFGAGGCPRRWPQQAPQARPPYRRRRRYWPTNRQARLPRPPPPSETSSCRPLHS